VAGVASVSRGPESFLFGVFDLCLGLVFLLFGLTFVRWLVVTATGGTFDTAVTWNSTDPADPPPGTPVDYFDLAGFTAWTQMGFFLLGLFLILHGVGCLLASGGKRIGELLATLAAILVGVAAAFNLVIVGVLMSNNYALPMMSLIAAIVGILVVATWWAQTRANW
jgi:hypothetical protein